MRNAAPQLGWGEAPYFALLTEDLAVPDTGRQQRRHLCKPGEFSDPLISRSAEYL